jgi:hypothetical protein
MKKFCNFFFIILFFPFSSFAGRLACIEKAVLELTTQKSEVASVVKGPSKKIKTKKKSKSKKKKSKKKTTTSYLTSIDSNILDMIRGSTCQNSPICSAYINSMARGLEQLGGKAHNTMSKVIKMLGRIDFEAVPIKIRSALWNCINSKPQCSVEKIKILKAATDLQWNTLKSVHPKYVENLLKNIESPVSEAKALRSVELIHQSHIKKAGTVKGESNYILRDGQYFDRKGDQIATNRIEVDKLHEDEAATLLGKLGHNILQVSEDAGERLAAGVDTMYSELRLAEEISITRSPDLVVTNSSGKSFLVDIYSPPAAISENTVDTVVGKVLEKASGRNRQTNRVVIYASKVNSEPENFVELIRSGIGSHNPTDLEEAIILFERNGEPMTLSVWP